MKLLGQAFSKLFSVEQKPESGSMKIYREWDRQRSRALGPSDLAEIDAIFSRQV